MSAQRGRLKVSDLAGGEILIRHVQDHDKALRQLPQSAIRKVSGRDATMCYSTDSHRPSSLFVRFPRPLGNGQRWNGCNDIQCSPRGTIWRFQHF